MGVIQHGNGSKGKLVDCEPAQCCFPWIYDTFIAIAAKEERFRRSGQTQGIEASGTKWFPNIAKPAWLPMFQAIAKRFIITTWKKLPARSQSRARSAPQLHQQIEWNKFLNRQKLNEGIRLPFPNSINQLAFRTCAKIFPCSSPEGMYWAAECQSWQRSQKPRTQRFLQLSQDSGSLCQHPPIPKYTETHL